MTVAVSCNLPDGVILGVDSAITVNNAQGLIVKVYENAEKLFQLGDCPIGLATYGLGTLGSRSIGSYVREFELKDPNKVVSNHISMKDTVEELRKFFLNEYQLTVVPIIEKLKKKDFKDIPDEERPVLGIVVGGFSKDRPLSEVWEIIIPRHQSVNSVTNTRKEGNFGGNWFALYDPIFRYTKGYDRKLIEELTDYFVQLRGSPVTPQEKTAINGILQKHEYHVPFGAMPIEEGVAEVRFLVGLVISHHRFSIGAPVVGGKVRIGLVTYKGERFRIIEGG